MNRNVVLEGLVSVVGITVYKVLSRRDVVSESEMFSLTRANALCLLTILQATSWSTVVGMYSSYCRVYYLNHQLFV